MHHEIKVDVDTYPEGGFRGNLVILGSFSSIMGGLGLMNSIGIYQAWISTHQLSNLIEGQIGWIFGICNFLVFFCGIGIGPILDTRGPRLHMWFESRWIVLTLISVGICSEYWHFLVVIGISGRMGTSFIFIVPVASIGHYFHRRRGAATGLALSGGSIGGVVFPLVVLENLAPKIGFAWSTHVIGLITLFLLVPGCLLVRANFLPKASSPPSAKLFLPDLSILKRPRSRFDNHGRVLHRMGLLHPARIHRLLLPRHWDLTPAIVSHGRLPECGLIPRGMVTR